MERVINRRTSPSSQNDSHRKDIEISLTKVSEENVSKVEKGKSQQTLILTAKVITIIATTILGGCVGGYLGGYFSATIMSELLIGGGIVIGGIVGYGIDCKITDIYKKISSKNDPASPTRASSLPPPSSGPISIQINSSSETYRWNIDGKEYEFYRPNITSSTISACIPDWHDTIGGPSIGYVKIFTGFGYGYYLSFCGWPCTIVWLHKPKLQTLYEKMENWWIVPTTLRNMFIMSDDNYESTIDFQKDFFHTPFYLFSALMYKAPFAAVFIPSEAEIQQYPNFDNTRRYVVLFHRPCDPNMMKRFEEEPFSTFSLLAKREEHSLDYWKQKTLNTMQKLCEARNNPEKKLLPLDMHNYHFLLQVYEAAYTEAGGNLDDLYKKMGKG